tara:strand:+ start:2443 stop:2697 length:255 start_codon:yes stop_codon:yes gene_type:complete
LLKSSDMERGAEKSASRVDMKIEIINNTRVNGQMAKVGDIVEVDEAEAKQLIQYKKGIVSTSKPKEKAKKTDRTIKSKDLKTRD